jgi:hypothetical protein
MVIPPWPPLKIPPFNGLSPHLNQHPGPAESLHQHVA